MPDGQSKKKKGMPSRRERRRKTISQFDGKAQNKNTKIEKEEYI